MTTIAATRNSIAGDRMVFVENKHIWYPTIKVRRVKGGVAGAAGDGGDCTRFLDWAEEGFNEKKRPKFTTPPGDDEEAGLLLVTHDGIFYMGTSDPCPELIAADFYAIGSGGKAAHAALSAGLSLEDAMKMAYEIDPYTRPPFDILELEKRK